METLFLTNQEDMVDVNLKSSIAFATQSTTVKRMCILIHVVDPSSNFFVPS